MRVARIPWEGGTVSAAWHEATGDVLLALTHGAGGSMDTPSLRAYAEAMAARGVGVVRFNLPYVEAGRKAPGPAARDAACWRAVAAHLRPTARRLFLGGRSYGGRIASHAVAAGAACDGLVFLAYPLHPPGKKTQLRTAQLAQITVPMLFLQGTRDAFADPALLARAVAALPRATLHHLEGGDHAHTVRGRTVEQVMAELADATLAWMRAARSLTAAAPGARRHVMAEREITPETTRVGWIGTGLMGASMCGHLLAGGYALTVFTRTRARAEDLLARGAVWADTPRAVAARADVVFTMVGTPADVREVVLGPDGALAGAPRGAVLVDMTTSEPALTREIDEAARARGVATLDAPVSGGDVGAREARLSIMVGGDREVLARVAPLFACLGRTVVHQGPAGAGQHTKMVNQILIATGMIGVCEALLYGYKAGLDLPTVLTSVSGGAAGSWSLATYAPRIFRGDFAPGFAVRHFLKDLGIALAEARRMRLALPGLALAEQLYRALEAQDHGASGIQALILALARLSAVAWP